MLAPCRNFSHMFYALFFATFMGATTELLSKKVDIISNGAQQQILGNFWLWNRWIKFKMIQKGMFWGIFTIKRYLCNQGRTGEIDYHSQIFKNQQKITFSFISFLSEGEKCLKIQFTLVDCTKGNDFRGLLVCFEQLSHVVFSVSFSFCGFNFVNSNAQSLYEWGCEKVNILLYSIYI